MAVETPGLVPYIDIGAQCRAESQALAVALGDVFAKGDFVGGKIIELLEAEIAAYLGVGNVVAVNSGTDALMFALLALGIGPGDEVITAANSFIASAAAIAHVGATPVFADVGPDQMLDPDAVEAALTPRTRALMPVHLTGRVADVGTLGAIAKRHGLAMLEDAAQAFGSRLGGKCAGSFGTVNAFSTHPLKTFNAAGDGGFITTDDATLAERVRRLRNHGFTDRNTVIEFGFVSRLDTIQAAILRTRLPLVDGYVARRRRNAERYRGLLVRTNTWFPYEAVGQFNSYHLFVIQTDRRDALQAFLRDRGIGTKIHYPLPIHLQPAAARLGYSRGSLPETERQSQRILSLPIHQFLADDAIDRITCEISEFFRDAG